MNYMYSVNTLIIGLILALSGYSQAFALTSNIGLEFTDDQISHGTQDDDGNISIQLENATFTGKIQNDQFVVNKRTIVNTETIPQVIEGYSVDLLQKEIFETTFSTQGKEINNKYTDMTDLSTALNAAIQIPGGAQLIESLGLPVMESYPEGFGLTNKVIKYSGPESPVNESSYYDAATSGAEFFYTNGSLFAVYTDPNNGYYFDQDGKMTKWADFDGFPYESYDENGNCLPMAPEYEYDIHYGCRGVSDILDSYRNGIFTGHTTASDILDYFGYIGNPSEHIDNIREKFASYVSSIAQAQSDILSAQQQSLNRTKRRIYTVEEATQAVSKGSKNKFIIQYR